MTIKVKMFPHLDQVSPTNGVGQVIINYFKHLPNYGIELVPANATTFDLRAGHAGILSNETDVSHLHGMYWSAEYKASAAELKANAKIVESIRHAKEVTVPSEWVAETIRRDARVNPHVIPHGIDAAKWNDLGNHKYVLWNKERAGVDVCDPTALAELATTFPNLEFISTFVPTNFHAPNVTVTGKVPHHEMKDLIEKCGLYASLVKETFCIGALEAMAAGKPILGWAHGGNLIMVEHGVNGYLANPGDYEDLFRGMEYCVKNWRTLGQNSLELVKKFDWPSAVEQVANVYKLAMESGNGQVSVIIPCYNYGHTLRKTVESAITQTYQPLEIIIVDDGSTDDTQKIGMELANEFERVSYYRKANGGVATARNYGIERSRGEFLCCLDADDQIKPKFLEACVAELQRDRSIGIAYTGLWYIQDGKEGLSDWPGICDYDKHLTALAYNVQRGVNQIPTCNVFRREAFDRVGGYKQKYAPLGAGAEDAELWARILSVGYGAKKATDAGLFVYSMDGSVSSAWRDNSISKDLLEPPWLLLHPWAVDQQHPFVSRATPTNKVSHLVRSYDEPSVSIIIPVGPGHEQVVKEALDSVESQTFRQWEVIVVDDSNEAADDKPIHLELETILKSYPYVRLISTRTSRGEGSKGAGYARNRGVEIARAPLLVFLDADDKLDPTFLDKTVYTWQETGSIVYTDYISSVITTQEDLQENFQQQDILRFTERTGEALVVGRSADFDCARAQRQPQYVTRTDPYHWCLMTCLVPKEYHNAIGGFDESMESFEDVLYHWMMAKAGYCYTRIPQELVVYRMYTGTRRERASLYTDEGRKVAQSMLNYSAEVLERMEQMPCTKCPGGASNPPSMNKSFNIVGAVARASVENERMQDDSFVLIEYLHPNVGNHHVYGQATKTYYGYKGGGGKNKFLVHKDDVALQPGVFREVERRITQVNVPQPQRNTPEPKPIPVSVSPEISGRPQLEEAAPVPQTELVVEPGDTVEFDRQPELSVGKDGEYVPPLEEESPPEEVQETVVASMDDDDIDLQAIPGITPAIVQMLTDNGYTNKRSILELGIDGLQQFSGIGQVRAEAIINAVSMG